VPHERALVVETLGTATARARALELAGIGARLAFVDGAEPDDPFVTDWSRLVALQASIVCVTGAHPDLLPELCAMLVRKQITLAPHVRVVAAADAHAARAAWLAGESAILPIFVPA
jgi:hypothetical protein